MQHEFPYIHGRPRITAKLGKNKDELHFIDFLVDTGADYTMMSRFDAAAIGVDYEDIKAKEIVLEAANMTTIRGKETRLIMDIRDITFSIPVIITKGENERVLGRIGFFDRFDVTFKQKHGSIILCENTVLINK